MKQDEQYRSNAGSIVTVLYVGHGYVIYKTTGGTYPAPEKGFLEAYPTLVKPRIKKTVWINVYHDEGRIDSGRWFKTNESCRASRAPGCLACAQVEIDCEEGEGL